MLCCAYAVDDSPVQLWTPGDPVPAEFIEAAHNPTWIVVAHNDQFETAIEQLLLAPRYSWPSIPLERHRCTMAMALAAGLPARLEHGRGRAGTRNRKDRCRRAADAADVKAAPRRTRTKIPDQVYWFDDQERLDRLYDYCRQDVEVERELYERLPPLSPAEQASVGAELPRSMSAASVLIAASPRPRARLHKPPRPRSMQSSPRSPAAPSPGSTRLRGCRHGCRQQGCAVEKLDKKAIEKLLRD